MASIVQQLFPQLPRDVEERILGCIPHNERACTLRLLNKAAAVLFGGPGNTTVQLTQPVPHHAFQRCWDRATVAWRRLPFQRRIQFLRLVATNGDLTNIQMAVKNAGCALRGTFLAAAAAARHIHVCRWLREQGCPWSGALEEAAQAGHRDVCEYLLAHGCPVSVTAAVSAAKGGHVDLMEWLQLQLADPRSVTSLNVLLGAAVGCDLATLQRLLHARQAVQDQGQDNEAAHEPPLPLPLMGWEKQAVLGAAAGSPTPDWRAKVEWLEAAGCPQTTDACTAAASLSDAVDRLAWFRQRGYRLDAQAVGAAARSGNVPALQYLLGEGGVRLERADAALLAAASGHLAALQVLHERDPEQLSKRVVQAAAGSGHLVVVAWLVEALGVSVRDLDPSVANAAARSGSVEVLAWLRERGCEWDGDAFTAAAESGCEEALQWLLARGCTMPETGQPYVWASRHGDLASLRCLRHLGCPWGSEATFVNSVKCFSPVAALRWLVEEGCPVDWDQALEAARQSHRPDGGREVATWLADELRRRRVLPQQQQ